MHKITSDFCHSGIYRRNVVFLPGVFTTSFWWHLKMEAESLAERKNHRKTNPQNSSFLEALVGWLYGEVYTTHLYLHLPNGAFFLLFQQKLLFSRNDVYFCPTTFFLLNPHCGPFWGVMFFSKKTSFWNGDISQPNGDISRPKGVFCQHEISDPDFYRWC